MSKKVHQIDPNSGKILNTFKSITDASRSLQKSHNGGISRCCNGKAQLAGGFKWQYAT